MKGYIKDNWAVLLLVLFLLVTELLHLAFTYKPFNGNVNWNAPVYYLCAQIGLTNFLPALILFLHIDVRNKASKSIAFGIVVWNIKEVIDEIAYISWQVDNVFKIDKTFWAQLAFILIIIILSAWAYSRWKY
jgi:hypothetical protein